jgi:hypothetical protein
MTVIVAASKNSATLENALSAANGIASIANQRRSSPLGLRTRPRGTTPTPMSASCSERGRRRMIPGERIAIAEARTVRDARCRVGGEIFISWTSQPPRGQIWFLAVNSVRIEAWSTIWRFRQALENVYDRATRVAIQSECECANKTRRSGWTNCCRWLNG